MTELEKFNRLLLANIAIVGVEVDEGNEVARMMQAISRQALNDVEEKQGQDDKVVPFKRK